MSSKFANAPALQKTPKICKIPPEKLPLPMREFKNYSLQAFVQWIDPATPLAGEITGQTLLHPYPLAQHHKGIILGEPHHLDVTLIYDPDTLLFIYQIDLAIGESFLERATTNWFDANPTIPFKTNLLQFEDPLLSRTVHSRLFS